MTSCRLMGLAHAGIIATDLDAALKSTWSGQAVVYGS
ncbi:hypothetical protein SBA3_3920011 [Candidatus Sulfopaludibacter sp. SbA3]|nr:hypothetical protein SBA3_3920011 [Candidatus Sulfopaludibacter sp. SbA3]